MKLKAHQRIIRERMAIEEEHNLFGNWWKNIDTTKKNAIVKEIKRQTDLPVSEKYE